MTWSPKYIVKKKSKLKNNIIIVLCVQNNSSMSICIFKKLGAISNKMLTVITDAGIRRIDGSFGFFNSQKF